MPGPVLTVTVTESTRRGAFAGPLMMLGHGILELALIVALLAGLAPLLNQDKVFITVSVVGGVILLWMGVSMLRQLPDTSLTVEASSDKSRNLVLAGILLSLANPYWLIWWATIGMGYIVVSVKYGAAGVAAFFSGHILADFIWYSLVSFGVARGKRFLSDGAYRKLIGFCASFLLLFSCYFFYSAIDRLV
ncbi:LysE family transporter [Desulfogranum japonicum]|uniref:LysE family transporter n=1 Tax=Desulfogranum japonicum TaxID=231447 RepID=UPI001E5BA34F|nr:LysE family transporter [Desulfogranum japonicum]